MNVPRDQPPPIRAGLLGLGTRGLHLLERWSDFSAVRVLAAADRHPEARSLASALCPEVSADDGDALSNPDVELVIAAVPVRERSAVGARVLRAGRHLAFPDPPIAATVRDAEVLFRLAAEAGRTIVVAAPWRDGSDFRAAAAVARSGAAGTLRFLRFEHWEPGVDDFTTGIPPEPLFHALDQLVALADRPATSVHAAIVGSKIVHAVVTFADGLGATVTLGHGRSVRVRHGWAFDGDCGGYAGGHRWIRTPDGEVYQIPAEAPPMIPFEEELRRILDGSAPEITRELSLRLVALLEAIEHSLASGQVVPVELVP